MDDRFTRVQRFIDYLISEEEREHAAVIQTSESIPLRRKLLFEMLDDYQKEKTYILKRLAEQGDETKLVATPYVEQK